MGTGAVSGHSTTPHTNQVFPAPASTSFAPDNYQGSTPRSEGGRVSADIPVSGAPLSSRSKPSTSTMPNKDVSCETCDNNFTFFKRKKICKDCQRSFCSTCLPKPPSSLKQNGRQCDKCNILTSGKFTRQQLSAWRVKDMRCFLDVRNISTTMCKEKHDLIDLLLVHFCLESNSVLHQQQEHDRLVEQLADRMRNSSFHSSLPHQVPDDDSSSSITSDHDDESHDLPASQSRTTSPPSGSQPHTDQTHPTPPVGREGSTVNTFMTEQLRERQQREMREAIHRLHDELAQDEPETRPAIQRANIDDLKTAEDADSLTVKQLKEILVNNFVDYRGCCEKHELVDRVKRLWNETQANKQRTADVEHTTSVPNPDVPTTSTDEKGRDPEPDVCRICMDAAIDCILLECGHMITCTKCGKRLADCPICRQYITRVVHVFRS